MFVDMVDHMGEQLLVNAKEIAVVYWEDDHSKIQLLSGDTLISTDTVDVIHGRIKEALCQAMRSELS